MAIIGDTSSQTNWEQLNELQGVGPLHHNLNGLAAPLGVILVGANGGVDDLMAL